MLRILFIGCGNISNVWLSSLSSRSDVDICGVVDLNREAAVKKASDFGLKCPVFTDVSLAIETVNPDAAVDNIIPSGRLELAEKCMKAGLHVLSEKPLADSMENAKKIIALSDRYEKQFFVMQNRRYNTGMFSFKNAIDSGRLGEAGYLGAEFFRDPRFGGFRERMDSPLLLDMAIHTFDQARFLLGRDPVSVHCHEYNPDWSWYAGAASAICTFRFEDNIIFHYTGSWCAPGMKTSWDSSWRFIGSSGTCIWKGTGLPEAEAIIQRENNESFNETSRVDIDIVECNPGGHEGCINEMINGLQSGIRPQTDCRDNIKSLAMVFAAIRSSTEKREVFINEILEV
ncbi:MAG: Gfo/Idh/MocA family oxidoreductase [Clostridia bacterium]|nr:Gfo/Idh/MocA family oxidoreductase [Clostridia bacterium]